MAAGKRIMVFKLNASVKQLDVIIARGTAGPIVTAVVIGLDAAGIF